MNRTLVNCDELLASDPDVGPGAFAVGVRVGSRRQDALLLPDLHMKRRWRRKETAGGKGSARVLFDGTNVNHVNTTTQLRDLGRLSVAAGLRRCMREEARIGEPINEAHRHVAIHRDDRHIPSTSVGWLPRGSRTELSTAPPCASTGTCRYPGLCRTTHTAPAGPTALWCFLNPVSTRSGHDAA